MKKKFVYSFIELTDEQKTLFNNEWVNDGFKMFPDKLVALLDNFPIEDIDDGEVPADYLKPLLEFLLTKAEQYILIDGTKCYDPGALTVVVSWCYELKIIPLYYTGKCIRAFPEIKLTDEIIIDLFNELKGVEVEPDPEINVIPKGIIVVNGYQVLEGKGRENFPNDMAMDTDSHISVSYEVRYMNEGVQIECPCRARAKKIARTFIKNEDLSKVVLLRRRGNIRVSGDGVVWQYADHHGRVMWAVIKRNSEFILHDRDKKHGKVHEDGYIKWRNIPSVDALKL